MDKIAYVVTADGSSSAYGVRIYLLGVFLDKTVAEEQAKNHGGIIHITEIPLNCIFPLTFDKYGDGDNEYCLGGYEE